MTTTKWWLFFVVKIIHSHMLQITLELTIKFSDTYWPGLIVGYFCRGNYN